MKILYVTNHWKNNSHHSNYSGYQRLVEFMTKYNDVTILTWGDEDKNYIDNNKKVRIRNVGNKNVIQRRFILSKEAKKIAKNYDVIHCLHADCAYHLNKNIKHIITLHNSYLISKYNKLKPKMFTLLKYFVFEKRAI